MAGFYCDLHRGEVHVWLLFDHGADAKPSDNGFLGIICTLHCCRGVKDEIVQLLSDHGDDLNPVDSTSLHSVAFYVAEGGTIVSSALCDEKCSGVQPMTVQVICVVSAVIE